MHQQDKCGSSIVLSIDVVGEFFNSAMLIGDNYDYDDDYCADG